MSSLRRANTIRIAQTYTRNPSISRIFEKDPFGDANEIPKRVGTTFPELSILKVIKQSRLNSVFTGFLSLLILALTLRENEIFYQNEFISNAEINLIRAVLIGLNSILMCLILQYYSIKLYLKKAYRECHIKSNLWNSPNRNLLIFELLLCSIVTLPYFD